MWKYYPRYYEKEEYDFLFSCQGPRKPLTGTEVLGSTKRRNFWKFQGVVMRSVEFHSCLEEPEVGSNKSKSPSNQSPILHNPKTICLNYQMSSSL